MNPKYFVWIFACLLVLRVSSVFAVELIDGGVGSILNVAITLDNQLISDVPDLSQYSTPASGSRVAKVFIDANDMHGYGVNFSSDRAGLLVRYDNGYKTTANNGNFIGYTMDFEQGLTGTFGTDIPPEGELRGFDLSQGDYEILFDENVVEPTIAAEFYMEVHTDAKQSLVGGTFQDVVTVTVRDL